MQSSLGDRSSLTPAVLDLAFGSSRDCIKVLELDGTLVLINRGGAAVMGFDEANAPIGRNWIEFWQGRTRRVARRAVAAAAAGRRAEMAGSLPTQGGDLRWWETTIEPIPGPEGAPARLLVISRDVTGQQQARAALDTQARLNQALVEATSEIVWHLDMVNHVTVRRGWREFTGETDDPSDDDGWLEALHPDDREAARLQTDQAVAAGQILTLVYRLKHHTGEWRWVEDRAVPTLGPDGRQTAWVGIITDIHDRTLADAALRDSEARLRLAVEATGLGTWDMDLRDGRRHWSKEMGALLGMPAGQDITRATVAACVHPDDQPAFQRHCDTAFRSGEVSSLTFRVVQPGTGGVRWLTSRDFGLIDAGGRVVRYTGTLQDVTERQAMVQALSLTERRHEALIAAVSSIVWQTNARQTVGGSRGWSTYTGMARDEEAENGGWLALLHPDDREQARAVAQGGIEAGTPYVNEYRLRRRDGAWRWVVDRAVPLHGEDGRLVEWIGIITDIHDRRTAEDRLRGSEERLRLALEVTGMGTWDVDMLTEERDWSPGLLDLLGLPASAAPSSDLFYDCVHPDDRDWVFRDLRMSDPQQGRSRTCVFRMIRQDTGEERWMEACERCFFDAAGRPVRRVGTLQDVTERKRTEQRLWTAAHTDDLTGLPNRSLFQTRLETAMAGLPVAGVELGAGVGLLVIDLDRFKEVNDTLGHDAGDAVLREVAGRLLAAVPAAPVVARLGGDEFGIVLRGDGASIEASAARVLAALHRPLLLGGRDVECGGSVGYALFPCHGREASALLKNADIALYAAKAAGRGRARAYEPAMRADMERRLEVLRHAKDSLAHDAIVPFYQPKVSLQTGRVVGFEALLRWTDAAGALRPPGALQEAFADPDLAVQLGARMLERVTADMAAWARGGHPFGHVALNVAAAELHLPGFPMRLVSTLGAAGLRPDQIEIEVTESVLLEDGAEAVGAALRALSEAGIAVALDDFGTGYASLTHLKRYPVSWLKIDRSFVSNLEEDSGSAAITRAVLGLARSLGIQVVAEGIETEWQYRFLKRQRCHLAQGYLIARPMPAGQVPGFLAGWRGVRSNQAA